MRRVSPPNARTARGLPALPGRLALAVLLCGAALAGCTDEPPDPPPPTEPPTDEPADADPDGTPDEPEPGDGDTDADLREAKRRKMDETARGLVASFRSRVYDPLRDVGLLRLRGKATFRVGETVATYSVVFDGEQDEEFQVAVVPESVPEPTPAGTERQLLRFANHSLRGGYQTAVNYYPPRQMLYTRAADNARIVTAQPWKADVQVSYRFDDLDLIVARGANAPRGQEVAEFEWRFFRGRYLLERMTFKGTGSTIEYEYDDRNGVVLLSEATIVRGENTMVATFEYEDVEKGEPETPLVPVPPGTDPDPDDDDTESPR